MWKCIFLIAVGITIVVWKYSGSQQATPEQFAEQCQVLDDYLNNHGRNHENLDVDYYVRRAPVWVNIVPSENPRNPHSYSVEQIEGLSVKIQEHLHKRGRKDVEAATWDAFRKAQSLNFSWADCEFGPPILTRESAADDAVRTQKRAGENNIKDEASWREYKDNADKEDERYNFENFRDEWREPRKRDGRIFFYGISRIGINPDGNQAVFYLENTCQGTNCGTAIMVIMYKYRGTWKTRDFVMSSTFRRE